MGDYEGVRTYFLLHWHKLSLALTATMQLPEEL